MFHKVQIIDVEFTFLTPRGPDQVLGNVVAVRVFCPKRCKKAKKHSKHCEYIFDFTVESKDDMNAVCEAFKLEKIGGSYDVIDLKGKRFLSNGGDCENVKKAFMKIANKHK